jgi:hypothetical protein
VGVELSKGLRIERYNMGRMAPAALRTSAAVLLLVASGCAGLGTWGDVLAGEVFGGANVTGEVRGVDTRRQEIQVRTDRNRDERVRYDDRTQVIHGGRRYAVRDLERGDRVRMRVVDKRSGRMYATVVQVEQSVRDRGSSNPSQARVERFEGTVARIDTGRGWFELQQARGGTVQVTLPYEPSRAVRDRFRRLRSGERVRIEGEVLNRSRVEIRRFL